MKEDNSGLNYFLGDHFKIEIVRDGGFLFLVDLQL